MNVEATSAATPIAAEAASLRAGWRDYLTLAKVRITLMVALTTAAGFVLVTPGPIPWLLLAHTLIGTALVASGASTLNQVLERRTDARMRRTAGRPLPAGRLGREQALAFGVLLAVVGMVELALSVNLLTAALGAITLALYVFVYTPMKRYSSISTLVGAVPGAIPPMMGCAAATGTLGPLAWSLFGILFLWQMPHFLAIAWLYRSDYARGGFPMLTVLDAGGDRTARQMILYVAALIPVSLLPGVLGYSGLAYLTAALLLGLFFLAATFLFARSLSLRSARKLVLVSVLYLPLLLALLLVDRALPGA